MYWYFTGYDLIGYLFTSCSHITDHKITDLIGYLFVILWSTE